MSRIKNNKCHPEVKILTKNIVYGLQSDFYALLISKYLGDDPYPLRGKLVYLGYTYRATWITCGSGEIYIWLAKRIIYYQPVGIKPAETDKVFVVATFTVTLGKAKKP